MVSLLASSSLALHTPLALWFDRRGGPASAAPRADDGFDQVLQLSGQADAPAGPCLCVTPESKLEEEGRVVGAALPGSPRACVSPGAPQRAQRLPKFAAWVRGRLGSWSLVKGVNKRQVGVLTR